MKFKYIFISDEVPEMIEAQLADRCNRLIKLVSNPYLAKPVSKHADMQILTLGNTLVLTHELYDDLKLSDNIIISFAENNHSDKYPHDVNLNALLLEKHLLCKTAVIDGAVKKLCAENNINIININQGYARCSALVINNSAVISADSGIIQTSSTLGYDTLKISAGNIILKGYDYGFIGGASFYDAHTQTVFFFGDITKHPNYIEIKNFCKKHNTDVISYPNIPLTDIGGAAAI